MGEYKKAILSNDSNDRFGNYQARIRCNATDRIGRIDIFYGGTLTPDGYGHGHVVSNDGVNIHFWRLPASEGGQITIDDSAGRDMPCE